MKTLDKKYSFLRPIKTSNLIRLGSKYDGGYVVDSEIIKNCNTLIAFGLGPDWSFELDYIKKNKNLKIYMYDHTVSSYPYIQDILKNFRRFITFRTTLKALRGSIKNILNYKNFFRLKNVFFFKEKITHPSKNAIDTDIEKVFSRIDEAIEIILKSDIEGSEYEVIDQIVKYSNRIKMCVFEFHWIDQKEEVFLDSIRKLKKYFEIIHIHGNNNLDKSETGLPILLEITLLNKKYTSQKVEYINKFPIKDIDGSNNPHKEDLAFSFQDE